MRGWPLLPDCFCHADHHYARFHSRTIVTKPDNRPDLSAIQVVPLKKPLIAGFLRITMGPRINAAA